MNKKTKEITKNLSNNSGIYAIKHNENIIFIGVAFKNTKLTVNQLINRLEGNENSQLDLKKYYHENKSELKFVQIEECDNVDERYIYYRTLYRTTLITFYNKNTNIQKIKDTSAYLSVYEISKLYNINKEKVRRKIRIKRVNNESIGLKNRTLYYSKEYVKSLFGDTYINGEQVDFKPLDINTSLESNLDMKELLPGITSKTISNLNMPIPISNDNLNQAITNEFSFTKLKNKIVEIMSNLIQIFKSYI